jgi:phosphatidylglycerophosphatase A
VTRQTAGLATQFATVFGIGWFPLASGTLASAIAVPFGAGLAWFGWQALLGASALVTALGIWACGAHAKRTGGHDPSECVIDEVAGQWLALLPGALTLRAFDWRVLLMGFILFRLLDISKLWPISAAEKLPGGLGVMADDVLAGVVAAVLLYGMLYIRLV